MLVSKRSPSTRDVGSTVRTRSAMAVSVHSRNGFERDSFPIAALIPISQMVAILATVVRRIDQGRSGHRGEPADIVLTPKQRVRVDQIPHSKYSLKSSSGSSKCSIDNTDPGCVPSLGIFREGGRAATSFATG